MDGGGRGKMSDVDRTFDELAYPLIKTILLTKHFPSGSNFIVGYSLVQRFMQSMQSPVSE